MKIRNAFRMSLRELFLLVVIAAVGMGWWRERQVSAPIRQGYESLLSMTTVPQGGEGYGYGEYRGLKVWVAVVTPDQWDSFWDRLDSLD